MNINFTLIGQAIVFILFTWFCLKFIWPPVVKALAERNKKIADGLAAAEHGVRQQELAEEKAKERLHVAKQEAAEVISQAQRRANQIVEEAKTAAVTESERIKESARAEVDQEVNRAKEALRKQVSALAVVGAEKILKREIDTRAHSDVLNELVSQI